jgi:hypothetical protein
MHALSKFHFILPANRVISFEDWTQEPKIGVQWAFEGREIKIDFGYEVDAYPTPEFDGVVVVFPNYEEVPYQHPDNAAIYNADGTLRLRLKAPKPLARHLPGYIHTPQEVAELEPEGFWQVGWGCGDGITEIGKPWMWAHIGLWRDVYERRYFDPATGLFDLEHYSTARR